MTPTILNLLSAIKASKAHSLVFCTIKCSRATRRMIKVLRKNNLIYGAAARNQWQLFVYLRYFRGRSSVTQLSAISNLGRPAYIKHDAAARLVAYHPSLLFIISSNLGVIAYSGRSMLRPLGSRPAGELLAIAW